MNILNRISSFVHSLASPSGNTCLACGTHAQLSRELPGICYRCVRSIPWITQIRCVKCGRAIGCPDCSRGDHNRRSFECNRSAVVYDSLMREWLAVYKYRGKERFAPLFGAMLNKAYLGMQREYSIQLIRGDAGQVDEHEGESAEQSKYNEGKVSIIHRHDLSINKHRPDIWRADAITYVPVSHERLIERGFNQAERMAVELSRYQGLPVIPLLQRTKHTEKQSFKGRREREISIQHAFDLRPDTERILNFLISEKMNGKLHRDKNHTINDKVQMKILLVDDVYTTGSTLEACCKVIREWGSKRDIHISMYTVTWARS